MKKLYVLSLTIITLSSLFWTTSLMFAQSSSSANPLMARVSLDPELHPDFAPEVKVAEGEENKKGYEAAYANLVLQLVAGGLLYVTGPLTIAVIAIGGLRYATSHGNQNMMEGAKKTLMYGIIGLLIVIFSYAIVRGVITLVVSTTG